jgi:hypothetical protein
MSDKEENNENTRANKVERAITILIGSPLEPGTLIKAEIFEELLGISRNSQAFSFLISDIRHALYPHGIYLSGEGFAETGAFEVWHHRDNQWVLKLAMEKAERDIEGKYILCVNTCLDGLSDLEKKRHENITREASLKLNAMRRAAEVDSLLRRKKEKKQITIDVP